MNAKFRWHYSNLANKRDCTIREAKTKAPISCAVTAQAVLRLYAKTLIFSLCGSRSVRTIL